MNVIAFYALYHQFKKIKKRKLRIALYFLILGVINFEGFTFFFTKNKIPLIPHPENRTHFKKADNPWLDSIDLSEYQAIIPLPHFHQGSENFWRVSYGEEMHRSMWAAVETGLPITGAFLGRTSISQTINQLELVAEPYRRPEILNDLPNDKAFLLFLHKKSYEQVWYRFNHLLYYIDPIYEDEEIKLFKMTIEDIDKAIQKKIEKTTSIFENEPLYKFGNILSTDSILNFVYKDFDDLNAEKHYRINGFEGIGSENNVIFEGKIPNQQAGQRYVFLCLGIHETRLVYPKTLMRLIETDENTGEEIQRKDWQINHDIRSYDKNWALIDTPFYLESANSKIRFTLSNPDLENQKLFFDELQLRLQNSNLFRVYENELMNNNRFFEYKKPLIKD